MISIYNNDKATIQPITSKQGRSHGQSPVGRKTGPVESKHNGYLKENKSLLALGHA